MHYLLPENRDFAEGRSRKARLYLPSAALTFFFMLVVGLVGAGFLLYAMGNYWQERQLLKEGKATVGEVRQVVPYRHRGGMRYRVTYSYSTALGFREHTDSAIMEAVQPRQKVPVLYLEQRPSVARLGEAGHIWSRPGAFQGPPMLVLCLVLGGILAWLTWQAGAILVTEQALCRQGVVLPGRVLEVEIGSGKYNSQKTRVEYEFEWQGALASGKAVYEAPAGVVKAPTRGAEIQVLARDARNHRPL